MEECDNTRKKDGREVTRERERERERERYESTKVRMTSWIYLSINLSIYARM